MAKSVTYALFGSISYRFGKLAKVQKDCKEIKAIFKKIVTDRVNSINLDDLKHKQRKDLVDYLIENQGISKSESENTLTIDTIIEEFMTFYVAGLDTTGKIIIYKIINFIFLVLLGHTLGMILYYLCVFPEVINYKIHKNYLQN